MKPLISVIIPVYNVQEYLSECLESVRKQTYENLEIFLVDDGSKDSSGAMCDQYALEDSRIKVIHKENGGLSSARNAALDVATGEYITFVDSDDYLADDYVEYLYDLLKSNNADLSICHMTEFYDDEAKKKDSKQEESQISVMSSDQALKRFLLQKNLFASAWCKLYKRELFAETRYPIGYYYEDMAIIHKIFLDSDKIVWSNQKKYFYRQRRNSIMNEKFNRKKLHRIEIAEQMKEEILTVKPELKSAVYVRCFIANIQTLRELPDKKEYSVYKAEINENIKKYRRETVTNIEAKASTRCMALVSYLGIRVLKFAGSLYSMVFKRL